VQAAITQTIRQLPQNIVPPTYQKVDPSQSPIIVYALTSASLKLSTARRVRAGDDRDSGCPRWRAWPRCRCMAPRSMPCGCSSIPRRWRRRQIGIDEVSDAIGQGNVNHARPASCGATDRAYRGAGHRPAAERRGVSVRWSWRGATVARCGSRTSAGSSTACRTPRPPPGTRKPRHRPGDLRQPGTNTVEVAARVREDDERNRAGAAAARSDVTTHLRPLGDDP
jgi:HAE1 family hydrophobic/amphiphilic exporter-1